MRRGVAKGRRRNRCKWRKVFVVARREGRERRVSFKFATDDVSKNKI
jgi:hypothetical protein